LRHPANELEKLTTVQKEGLDDTRTGPVERTCFGTGQSARSFGHRNKHGTCSQGILI